MLTEHQLCDGGILVVVNVYCPMVERDSENQARMDYKIKFYSALKDRCAALEKAGKYATFVVNIISILVYRSIIVVGDFNFTREIKDSSYLQEDPVSGQINYRPIVVEGLALMIMVIAVGSL